MREDKPGSGSVALQNGAGAFLRRNGLFLLMKRSPGRKIAPGVWSCVGGHMEPNELNDPHDACLREIKEETGIGENQIDHLALRYVILRRAGDIIRQNFIYFGETDADFTAETDEGTLHWVPEEQVLMRRFTSTFGAMLRHYLCTPCEDRVIVGVAGNQDDTLKMTWSAMEDFE